MTKMVHTHPDLPDLPEGQFWRIYIKNGSYGFQCVMVELRAKKEPSWLNRANSVKVASKSVDYWPERQNARADAITLANKICAEQENLRENTLGDLNGDHPPD